MSNALRTCITVLAVLAVFVVLIGLAFWAVFGTGRDPSLPLPAAESVAAERAAAAEARTVARADIPRPAPEWIWSSDAAGDGERVRFRRRVDVPAGTTQAELRVSADNVGIVRVNDREVGTATNWSAPDTFDLSADARTGALDLDITVENEGGPGGLLAVLDFTDGTRRLGTVVTDAAWTCGDDGAAPAVVIAAHGDAPWGFLDAIASAPGPDLRLPDGYRAELVYRVPRDQGSWVCLTVDDRGRLLASDQRDGLFRVTLGDDGAVVGVSALDTPAGAAQGLFARNDDLYCIIAGNRAEGPGIYRLRDTNGDDAYDGIELLHKLNAGGEHGPHAVIPSPDGTQLYVVAGNHTRLPADVASDVPERWGEDHLLPRLWDANGHAVNMLAPGGWILRMDPDGGNATLVACGFRNTYDIAFNANGELFTYDADMEWDLGAPWYRPTRINHVVPGADYGWRSGTAKWLPSYPDSLPATLDLGPGSPTGLLFGYGAAFPERHQRALFALDWTYGTIYAIDVEPDGATYRATAEVFAAGAPFPVADAVIRPQDGAMYVVVGGRNVPSAIYRIVYDGSESHQPLAQAALAHPPSPLHAERRRLESAPDLDLSEVTNALASPDRWIRHQARVRLEAIDVTRWTDRLTAGPLDARLQALVAAARLGDPGLRGVLETGLEAALEEDLTPRQRTDLLRAWSLMYIRLGRPAPGVAYAHARRFERLFPTGDDDADRALVDLLVYLGSTSVVARTVPLLERRDAAPPPDPEADLLARSDRYGKVIVAMAAAPPQRQQVYYALALRNATVGWTPELRERYFRWFTTAKRTAGGNSFTGFLDQIRKDALAHLSEADQQRYAAIGTDADPLYADGGPQPEGPGRAWTVDSVYALAAGGLHDRNFERGAEMFLAAQCARCHRFAGIGQAGGPDLTALRTRFTSRALIESLVEPSRTISDQYMHTEIERTDGTLAIGRIVERDDERVVLRPSLLAPDALVTVNTADIAAERPSAVSGMMPRLLDRLNADEVLDLLAYLLSEGDARDSMFE